MTTQTQTPATTPREPFDYEHASAEIQAAGEEYAGIIARFAVAVANLMEGSEETRQAAVAARATENARNSNAHAEQERGR